MMPMNTHCVLHLRRWQLDGVGIDMIKCNKFKTYDGLMPLIYYQINKLICRIVPTYFPHIKPNVAL